MDETGLENSSLALLPRGGIAHFPSLDHHPILGGVCKAVGLQGNLELQQQTARLLVRAAPCVHGLAHRLRASNSVPTDPHGWSGSFVRTLIARFLTDVLPSKHSLLSLQPGETQPGSNLLILTVHHGPLNLPPEKALNPGVLTTLEMKQTKETLCSLSRPRGLRKGRQADHTGAVACNGLPQSRDTNSCRSLKSFD